MRSFVRIFIMTTDKMRVIIKWAGLLPERFGESSNTVQPNASSYLALLDEPIMDVVKSDHVSVFIHQSSVCVKTTL